MTGEEILMLFSAIKETKAEHKDLTKPHYAHGIKGLADFLGCGKTKAQAVKNSGVIDDAIVQNGRKIIIDKNKAFELLNNQ